jgi:CHASE3 domain sensor protein
MQFNVKISKAKAALTVEFDELPDAVKVYIVEEGLKKVLNSATTKVTAATVPDEDQRVAQAMAMAEKRLEALKAGKVSARASKSDGKVPGAVMTEARRQAKVIIKAQIKAANKRISDYEAKAITEAANLYLQDHPELIEAARVSIEQANALASTTAFDISGIPASPAKIAKNNAKKTAERETTAAKTAGRPGPQASAMRQRPAAMAQPTA